MKYHIRHTTRYTGSEPVSVGHNEAWLTPRITGHQQLLRHRLEIIPEPSMLSIRQDAFGNQVTQFSFNQGYDALTVTALNEVELQEVLQTTDEGVAWENIAVDLGAHQTLESFAAHEFLYDSPRCRANEQFADYARHSFFEGRPIRAALLDLMQRFHEDFQFDAHATVVTTPVEQVFEHKRGVCQDFAHLMISMVRSVGLSAKYVSGYLRTLPPPGKERLIGADASHAWLSVYCGALGWIDFDPTNNCIPWRDHITVAWGRDYDDVTPLKGVYIGGGTHQLHVSVDVCDDDEWQARQRPAAAISDDVRD